MPRSNVENANVSLIEACMKPMERLSMANVETANVSLVEACMKSMEHLSLDERRVILDQISLSQMEACMKSMEHLSLDQRLAMLDQHKNETIKQDTQARKPASVEQPSTTRSNIQASGTNVSNMQPFLQQVPDILSNNSPLKEVTYQREQHFYSAPVPKAAKLVADTSAGGETVASWQTRGLRELRFLSWDFLTFISDMIAVHGLVVIVL